MSSKKRFIFLLSRKILFLFIFSCISNEKITDEGSVVIVTVDYFIAYGQRIDLTVPSSRIIKDRDFSYRTFTITGGGSSFTLSDAKFAISNYNIPLQEVKESSKFNDIDFFLDSSSVTITPNTVGYITILCRYALYHLVEVKQITERGIFINWKTQLNGSNNFLD